MDICTDRFAGTEPATTCLAPLVNKAAEENFPVDAFQGAIILFTIVAKIIKVWVMSLLNAGKLLTNLRKLFYAEQLHILINIFHLWPHHYTRRDHHVAAGHVSIITCLLDTSVLKALHCSCYHDMPAATVGCQRSSLSFPLPSSELWNNNDWWPAGLRY